jgi:hypothetical protein
MPSSPFSVLFPAVLTVFVRTEYGAVQRNTVTLTEYGAVQINTVTLTEYGAVQRNTVRLTECGEVQINTVTLTEYGAVQRNTVTLTEYGAVQRNTATLTEMLRTDEAFPNNGSQQYYWHRFVSCLSKDNTDFLCIVNIYRSVRIVTNSAYYMTSSLPSARMYQHGCLWTDLSET